MSRRANGSAGGWMGGWVDVWVVGGRISVGVGNLLEGPLRGSPPREPPTLYDACWHGTKGHLVPFKKKAFHF